MGIRYEAGREGVGVPTTAAISRRSTERCAHVLFPRVDELPPVSAAPVPAGLVIFEHREGKPFDLAAMARQPGLYMADFDELTPAPDADDWTVEQKSRGRLRTHLDDEELFLVRTRGDATLAVVWGDMPLEQYLRERLAVSPDADGCLSSMESQPAGRRRRARARAEPHPVLPAGVDGPLRRAARLSDRALGHAGRAVARAHRSEHHDPRQPAPLRPPGLPAQSEHALHRRRVAGNLRASFADSGQDVLDMGRHLVTGTTRENIHTGQLEKRTSLLAAVPMLVIGVARLEPVQGGKDFVEGIQSGVQVAADAVSATNNAVINPLLQITLGLASPDAADDAGHFTGAVTQAWAKNLPGSERSMDALNPLSLWYHNRAFKPTAYTRTDTQLNIDRLVSIANIFGVYGLTTLGGGWRRRWWWWRRWRRWRRRRRCPRWRRRTRWRPVVPPAAVLPPVSRPAADAASRLRGRRRGFRRRRRVVQPPERAVVLALVDELEAGHVPVHARVGVEQLEGGGPSMGCQALHGSPAW